MSSIDPQILALLEAIERDSGLSQRELARISGLNVSKVNYLIRKFADKGLIKLKNVKRNPNKLGYLYILTPVGALEKTRLAYGFMRRTLREYSALESVVRRQISDLRSEGVRKVVLLGMSEITQVLLRVISEHDDLDVLAVVDSGISSISGFDVPVLAPEEAPFEEADRVIICNVAESGAQALSGDHFPPEKIVIINANGSAVGGHEPQEQGERA